MVLTHTRRWVLIVGYVIIVLLVFVYLLPYLWMIMASFRSHSDPFARSILPSRFVLTNYLEVFRQAKVLNYFRNSLVVAVSASVLALVLAIPAAYGFARFRFAGQGAMMAFLLLVRTFPGVLLAIALFVMVVRVGLYDTHVPLILANTMFNLPFAIWNLTSVFEAFNPELEESAMVEGCTRLGAMVRVLLPISLPGLAATFAFVFILTWNEYLFATTFITTDTKRLVPTIIASSIGQFTIDYAGLVTMAVLATVPIIILFILIQRYIISGLSLGGLKG